MLKRLIIEVMPVILQVKTPGEGFRIPKTKKTKVLITNINLLFLRDATVHQHDTFAVQIRQEKPFTRALHARLRMYPTNEKNSCFNAQRPTLASV